MKLEEAIVFLLASSGHGMKTEQIARKYIFESIQCLFSSFSLSPRKGMGHRC